MTIDEAISHCLEVAEQNETQAEKIGRQFIGSAMDKHATDCRECAADHRQLAEWLTELKELRNSIGAVKLKDMKEAVGLLQELNTENVQLTSQLVDAKRLLKLAVEDFAFVSENFINNMDSFCSMYNHISGCAKGCPMSGSDDYGRCKWRYADEALKLIGGSENG